MISSAALYEDFWPSAVVQGSKFKVQSSEFRWNEPEHERYDQRKEIAPMMVCPYDDKRLLLILQVDHSKSDRLVGRPLGQR